MAKAAGWNDDPRTLNIRIDNINGSLLHVHYSVIEAVSGTNIGRFWDKIWNDKVLAIVMIYAISDNVREKMCRSVKMYCSWSLGVVCSILSERKASVDEH